jgi:hypothetical protein
MRKPLYVVAGLLTVVGIILVMLQTLDQDGWSKDKTFDDGQMAILVQFKVNPNPTTPGSLTVMARVKNTVGYSLPVDYAHFTVSMNGERVIEALEGDRIGEFSSVGTGFYQATLELESSGDYEVEFLVMHGQSRFATNWPLTVN